MDGGAKMAQAVRPTVGLFVTVLLEDDYNKTAHMRPGIAQFVERIAGVLRPHADVVVPPFAETEEQASAAARMFNSEGVDLIVAVLPAYNKGIVPTRCFLETTAPILVWNTQQIRRLPEDADFDLIMVNSGMAGVPEMTSALVRMGRRFWIVTSHIEDQKGLRELADWIKAAGVVRRLRSARIGTIGAPFEGATDMMVDQLSLRRHIGPVCWPIEPQTVAREFEAIPQGEVETLAESEQARYRVEMDGAPFRRSCRLALALERVVCKRDIQAVASFDYIWLNTPQVGIISSYGTGRLCSLGIPAATEGDAIQVTAMLILQELTGQATFLEPYVMDFDREAIILSHDGHGNPALADEATGVRVRASIYYEGLHGRGAALEFAYEPGLVTNLALVNTGEDRWRLIISEGESIQIKPRPVAAPQMLFRPQGLGIAEWCDQWCLAGAPHHHALAYGHLTPKLTKVAELLGVEAVVVK
jgi:L-arabinose isomerase